MVELVLHGPRENQCCMFKGQSDPLNSAALLDVFWMVGADAAAEASAELPSGPNLDVESTVGCINGSDCKPCLLGCTPPSNFITMLICIVILRAYSLLSTIFSRLVQSLQRWPW